MHLQGLCSSDAVWPPDERDVRALAGNSMSLCLIEPILRNAMVSCGALGAEVADRWGSGLAQVSLVLDAWGHCVPVDIFRGLPRHVAAHLAPDKVHAQRDGQDQRNSDLFVHLRKHAQT